VVWGESRQQNLWGKTVMLDASIQNELLREVEQLSLPLQRKVVDFAHSLTESKTKGTPGRQLLDFVGILSPKEGKAMTEAVQEGCERIDADEW
jgi:hypothetical protein